MIKVGINGFGRIGRLILRALLENYKGKIEVVGINDLGSIEANAHLIKYDSTHGTLNHDVKTTSEGFQIGDQNIKVFAERDPAKLPWGKIGADVVLECTGFFLDKASASKHIEAGAKKVIISAPAKEVDFTVVQGVNSKDLKKEHNIISNGSCTTNCLAPVAACSTFAPWGSSATFPRSRPQLVHAPCCALAPLTVASAVATMSPRQSPPAPRPSLQPRIGVPAFSPVAIFSIPK